MRKTIFDGLAEAIRRQRLKLLTSFLTSNLRRLLMNLGFLDGFKTYLVAAAMVLAGLSQLVGRRPAELRRPVGRAPADGGAGGAVPAEGNEGVKGPLRG